jgi:glyoxylase-like metal-dependent hydrolase (beta-lactamase superfamily II)
MDAEPFPELDSSPAEVTADALKARLDAGERVTVLDTRRPDDFEAWALAHPNVTNVNVPFTAFLTDDNEPAEAVPEGVPDGPLVVTCAKGRSSSYVAQFLAARGREAAALADGMQGWARLYEATELATGGATTVVQYHRPSSGCLAYLVVSEDEAAVVDPLRAFAGRYADDAAERGAALRYVIDTHVHADHLSGLRDVAAVTDADPVLPAGAVARGHAFDTYLVDDGDHLALGAATLEAVHLPGHTTEMTGYRVEDCLLTGDTLFVEGVARPDLEAGAEGAPDAARQLHETLQSLVYGEETGLEYPVLVTDYKLTMHMHGLVKAEVKMEIDGVEQESIAEGVGPLDAVLSAVKSKSDSMLPLEITDHKVEMLSPDTESLVVATLKLENGKQQLETKAASPDTIEATLEAFLKGLAMAYRKESKKGS